MRSSAHSRGVRYRKVYLASLTFKDFDRRTIPLFVRCGDPGLRLWIELLRRAHHPYLYYIDDNFWELPGRFTPSLCTTAIPESGNLSRRGVSHANQVYSPTRKFLPRTSRGLARACVSCRHFSITV